LDDPGFPIDVYLFTELLPLTEIFMGDVSFRAGRIGGKGCHGWADRAHAIKIALVRAQQIRRYEDGPNHTAACAAKCRRHG
jgi:hypothetical protein